MLKVVIIFSQSHVDFRIAEFDAICEMFAIKVDRSHLNQKNHIFVLEFQNRRDIENLLSRAVLVKFAVELSIESGNYDDLYEEIEKNPEILEKFDREDESFAIRFFAIGRKKNLDSIAQIRTFLDRVPFKKAPISLNSPKNELFLVEEYENATDDVAKRIFFGKLIGEGKSELKTKYNLKDRCYIGNTTMDPELSFIQANLAMVQPSNLVVDPFVGTGGLILPAAEFGAFVMGTEINYQTARAKGRSSRQGIGQRDESESIRANFEQYGTESQLLSILIADSSKHLIWSPHAKFDVIVADPPYGVREKARKTVKNKKIVEKSENFIQLPQKEEYDLEDAFCDLLDLAAQILVNNGRVSFWYPVILENYCAENLPHHPAMELISNCEQGLTRKTSRRLLTYRKIRNAGDDEKCKIQVTGVSHYRSVLFTPKC
uniref:tRNA (guanine(10)-N(2))-methyltransferase TRMT11 n=1 Tax=Caenorhabditis japonica TaxID=281687 RepID=A0A8R1I8C2_CAEJA